MKLFVIEGLDGSGKSTQIGMLKDFLSEKNLSFEYMHFPRTEAPWFGELIARFLRGEFGSLSEVDPWLVAMLYAGDRKDASPIIEGWMNEGKIVILDRYTFSNIAYQCAKLEDPGRQQELKNWILKLEFEHFKIPLPDLNIFLDVPFRFTADKLTNERNGTDRSYLKGQNDIHESDLDFQRKVRDIYLKVASEDNRLVAINCSDGKDSILPPAQIFNKIIEVIKSGNLL